MLHFTITHIYMVFFCSMQHVVVHLESLTEQALKASVGDEACGEIEEGLVHVVGFLVAEF